MECVGNEQQRHQANHGSSNFVLDWITWVRLLCCLAVTSGNIQILQKKVKYLYFTPNYATVMLNASGLLHWITLSGCQTM